MEVLKIKDLKKHYTSPEGEKNVVVDIESFAIKEEEQIAIEGTSGCGKTTFLNLVAGILQCNEGTIEVMGQNIAFMKEEQRDIMRANHIGYIFQTFNLLQGYTALENLYIAMAFARKNIDKNRAQELLEQVGLKDRMNYVPAKLSIGQQQRVAVARALINEPKLVLADEPTGNLDAKNAQEALTLIRDICKNNKASLMLVSHDKDILKQFETLKKMTDINNAAKRKES